jgi:TonB family protein
VISKQRIHGVLSYAAVALAVASVAFSQTESNRNSDQNNQPEEKIYSAKEVSKKVVIKDKPVPEYTLIARQHGVEGVVVLRAVFRSSGKVTNIQATKTLPDGLTDQAIDAAKRIKFDPAEKDGHPVAMFLQLEYHFSL